MSKITHLIIHCSASEFGDRILIDQWHKERGFAGIGYHWVILNGRLTKGAWYADKDGVIQVGRPENGDDWLLGKEVGAHTLGYNGRSIGICLIGVSDFSKPQRASLLKLTMQLMKTHGIILENVLGHCETESGIAEGKTCPNFNMHRFRADIALAAD